MEVGWSQSEGESFWDDDWWLFLNALHTVKSDEIWSDTTFLPGPEMSFLIFWTLSVSCYVKYNLHLLSYGGIFLKK